MSPREKKLLILFATAVFVMANLIGLSFYKNKAEEVKSSLQSANGELARLGLFAASSEERLDEIEWLERNLPEPAEYQNVQTALQTYCVSEAGRVGLTFTELPPDRRAEDIIGGQFERVQVRFKLSGSERNLYKWLDQVYQPDQLRTPTRLLLTPNNEDKSLIDCTATIEQWYIPVPPSI